MCAFFTDPLVSAGLGMGWCVSRIFYTFGYVNKNKSDGSGRAIGLPFFLFEFALVGLSGLSGYQMVMG